MSFAITTSATFGTSYNPAPAVTKPICEDIQTKWAKHCAESTARFLQESPFPPYKSYYDTPSIALDVLIERLLRQSPVPLSAALASLTLINWITESGSCPLASSSAHHLFCTAFMVFVQGLREVDNNNWADIGNYIPMSEVEAAEEEVKEFLRTDVSDSRWDILALLVGTDESIDELFDLQYTQSSEEECESWYLDSMEEELVNKGFLKFEHGDDNSTP